MSDQEQVSLDFDTPISESESNLFSLLKLERPLVFFDLETTGLDIKNDRIVQLGFIRVNPNRTIDEWKELVNPKIPIPKETTEIHGITDEMVRESEDMHVLAPQISGFLENCDLGGFNIVRFDLPFLQEELTRHGYPLNLDEIKVIDPQVIFHKREPRNLAAAYHFYCGETLEDAHDAMVDIRATLDVFNAQLAHYGDLPQDVPALHELCNEVPDRFVTPDRKFYWRNGEAVISFGKYRSKTLKWIVEKDKNYLNWMVEGEFHEKTKAMIKEAMEGRFPKKG